MRSLILACLPTAALAHATLQSASPAPGAVLRAPPTALMLTFSEPVEARFSRVTVRDQAGAPAGAGAWSVDPHDPRWLTLPVTRLAPGTYTVTWRALSVDTHRSDGSYQFRVSP